jgi:ribosomal-protein-alanine N-acetyltransferase
MNIILQTPRIIIREFNADEESLLVNLYLDERVTQHVSKRSIEENKQKFADALKGYQDNTGLGRWGIFNPANDDFIGVCILKPADADPTQIELGYVLAEAYWGKGLATELANALVKYGFEQKSLTEICACTDPENIASQNVLTKAGLTRQGTIFWHGRDLPFFKIVK